MSCWQAFLSIMAALAIIAFCGWALMSMAGRRHLD